MRGRPKLDLYACPFGPNCIRTTWSSVDYTKREGENWVKLERPPADDEYLEYDEQNDCIVIKKREKSTEELEAEKQAAVKNQLVTELPDIILQNKDDPAALAQALCDRAKQIEIEATNETGRDPKAI